MRKYPKYKASGVDWLNQIPVNWWLAKLKFKADIKFSNVDKLTEPSEHPVLLCNYVDVYKNEKIHSGIDFMQATANNNEISKFRITKGDVLITKDSESVNDIAVPALVVEDFENVLCGYHLAQIKSQKDLTGEYLFRLFQSKDFNQNFESSASGMTRYGLSVYCIKNVIIPIPSLPEQQAIVRFLNYKTGQIDRFITNRQKQIELLKEQKAGIINKAVTKGINPNAKMKDSGIEWIGEIPENWMAKKIKYAGRIINGYAFDSKDFKSSGVRVVKIANIQTRSIEWKEESFVEKYLYDELVNFRLKKDDLVFALTRPIISTGIKAAIIETNEPMLINQRNAVFRPKSINRRFLYYIIFNEDFIQFFESLIDDTGQQPNISSEDIANIAIPFPSLSEQIEIVDFLDTRCNELDNLISKYQKQIDLMQEYRTSLISQAVTGKIDVREWEPKKKQTP